MRVVSLNIWDLPWPIGRDVVPRMRAIAAALPGLAADVVTLQEVWSEATARGLIEAGGAAGLSHHWNGQASTGGSGLLVLSRFAILRAHFEPFLTRGLPERVWHGDYWGGKGFGSLELSAPAGPLTVVDTHLHAQYGPTPHPEYAAHRLGQVVQLAAYCTTVSGPLLALGDFNLREDEPDHQVLAGIAGLRDAAIEYDARQDTILSSNPYHDHPASEDSRIDYAFLRDGTRQAVRVRNIRRIFDETLSFDGYPGAHSDHAGLAADFDVEPLAEPRPLPIPSREAIERAALGLERGRQLARERRTRERIGAGAGAAASGLALAIGRRPAVSRRRLLGRLFNAGALLLLPGALGLTALSELAIPTEIAAFDEVEALLRGLPASSLPRRGSSLDSRRSRLAGPSAREEP